jgi:ethanolamine-phosphate cytidylyltransferase
MSAMEHEIAPGGEPAPEVRDDRIWIDGCFDFFHHGAHPVD